MKKLSLFLILNLPFFMGCSMNGEISSRKFEQLYQRKDQFGTVETIEFLGHDTKNAYIRKWTRIPMANKGKNQVFFTPLSRLSTDRQVEILLGKKYHP